MKILFRYSKSKILKGRWNCALSR